MLSVACVLRPSKDFDVEYVTRLKAGVEANLKATVRFICLTDKPLPNVECMMLRHDWPGWWSKIELFRLPPPVLYFDLDTIIVGDLTDIAAHAQKSRFTMLRDFYREKGFGSGMMSWSVWMNGVYEAFAAAPDVAMSLYRGRGDQSYLEDQKLNPATWQDTLPRQVVSYKVDVKDKGVPKDARVCCFHGNPKPRDIGWII